MAPLRTVDTTGVPAPLRAGGGGGRRSAPGASDLFVLLEDVAVHGGERARDGVEPLPQPRVDFVAHEEVQVRHSAPPPRARPRPTDGRAAERHKARVRGRRGRRGGAAHPNRKMA